MIQAPRNFGSLFLSKRTKHRIGRNFNHQIFLIAGWGKMGKQFLKKCKKQRFLG